MSDVSAQGAAPKGEVGEEHPAFRRVEAVHDQRGDQDGGRRYEVDEELAGLGGSLGLCAPLDTGIPLSGVEIGYMISRGLAKSGSPEPYRD